ncbi:hypothetical protein [Rhodospirillaceae bacterium SYSU D60014]|uniref:hypothetical protein n=1 Tax=Virgifigura deserti TaxID=2268457 RepID=UPI000E669202
MRSIALRLILLLGLLIPIEAGAVDAQQVERDVVAALEALAGGANAMLAYNDVEAHAAGPAFNVAVHGLRLMPDTSSYLDVGTLRFRLTPDPADADLSTISDVRFPAELPYRGVDGATEAIIELPSFSFTGSWSHRLQMLLAGNAAVGNLRVLDAAGTELLRLAQAVVDLTTSDFDGDSARANLSLQHGGLALRPAMIGDHPLAPHLVPRDMTLQAGLEDLPGRELAGAFQAFIASGDADEAAAAARRLLVEAGSKLRLSDTVIDTGTVRLSLDGSVQADPAAARDAVAAMDIEIAGLDALIALAVAAPPVAGGIDAAAPLQILRAFGTPASAADGVVVYRYAISLSPAGELLVNGRDFRFLLPQLSSPAN